MVVEVALLHCAASEGDIAAQRRREVPPGRLGGLGHAPAKPQLAKQRGHQVNIRRKRRNWRHYGNDGWA